MTRLKVTLITLISMTVVTLFFGVGYAFGKRNVKQVHDSTIIRNLTEELNRKEDKIESMHARIVVQEAKIRYYNELIMKFDDEPGIP